MSDVDKVKQGLNCCKNSYPKNCKFCPYEKDCTHHETCDILIRNAISVIAQMEQEIDRKEGHWEVLTMCANEGTYCSVCHTKVFDFVHPPKRKLSMFCPHCGSKMKDGDWDG